MLFFLAACLAPAFALSFLGCSVLRRVAPRCGLVDQPAARKVHVTPTPLGGGIGIWLGTVFPLAAAHGAAWIVAGMDAPPPWIPQRLAVHAEGVLYRAWQMWAVVAGGTVLAVTGLLDDLANLPWKPRLAVQFLVAVGLVAAGVQATVFVPLPAVGWVVSAVWMLVLVNSFNFLDNMDGLSGGIGCIAALLSAVVMLSSSGEPHWLVGGMLLVLAGSLGGFLCHNLPPAKIFMGDCGSYFLGLMLAATTILGTFYGDEHGSRHVILAPLCVLAVPLYDVTTVLIVRWREGRSPFQPDKSHFSHRLVEMGLSPANAVRTIHLATLTTGLGALVLYRVDGWRGALLVVAMVGCVLAIVAVLEFHGRTGNDPEE